MDALGHAKACRQWRRDAVQILQDVQQTPKTYNWLKERKVRMMTFRQMVDRMNHADGTYVSARCSQPTKTSVAEWIEQNNITNPVDTNTLHCTIVYSRRGAPDLASYPYPETIKAQPKCLSIFPTASGKKCLVIELEDSELNTTHDKIHNEYDVTYDYDDYKPHVTVSYDYDGGIEHLQLPTFPIAFDRITVEPLEP